MAGLRARSIFLCETRMFTISVIVHIRSAQLNVLELRKGGQVLDDFLFGFLGFVLRCPVLVSLISWTRQGGDFDFSS